MENDLITSVVREMIDKNEIHEKYFASSKSLLPSNLMNLMIP